MVIKLMKHELFRICRIAVIPAAVMILLAIFSRISLAVYTGDNAVPFLLILFYVFAVLATLLVCYFLGITRFYKTFFSGEGYMTLSLPASADQLIWAKLLSSLITIFCGIVVCLLSATIFLIGLPAETWEIIREVLSLVAIDYEAAGYGDPLYIFEEVVAFLVEFPAAFLYAYAVMSVAQLFTVKNRKGIAVAFYIGILFVWSILSSVIVDPFLASAEAVSIHLMMWIEIVFGILLDVGCYFLVRYILKNKVNLIA